MSALLNLPGYDAWKTDYPGYYSTSCPECDRSTGDGGRDEEHEMWCSEHPTYHERWEKAAASVVRQQLKDDVGTTGDMHFTDVLEKQTTRYTIIHDVKDHRKDTKGAWVTARFFVSEAMIEEAL
jgi:hypothetical protein